MKLDVIAANACFFKICLVGATGQFFFAIAGSIAIIQRQTFEVLEDHHDH